MTPDREISRRADRRQLRGEQLIGSGWHGQIKFDRTTDTTNLEPVSDPFSPFEQFLGRLVLRIRYWLHIL